MNQKLKLLFTLLVFALVFSFSTYSQNFVSAGLTGVNGVRMDDTLRIEKVVLATGLSMYNSDGTVATNYSITSGTVSVNNSKGEGKILAGGNFDQSALTMLKSAKGKTVMITFKYVESSGITRLSSVHFYVR